MSRHAAPPPGARRYPVLHATRLRAGDRITIGDGTHRRHLRVTAIAGDLAVWVIPWRWYHTAGVLARTAASRRGLRALRAAATPRRRHPARVTATRKAPDGSAGLLEPSGAVRLLPGGDADA